jgi:hypothetical protein
MGKVKQKREQDKTVRQYIDYVTKACQDALNDPQRNITHYYMLLDKGATVAKHVFAHQKRDRVEPMPDPDPTGWYPYVMPDDNDGQLPFDWEALIANRGLTRREVYWLFHKAIMDPNVGVQPNPGQSVLIHGAPHIRLTKAQEKNDPDCYNRVYFAKGMPPPAPHYPVPVCRAECREFFDDQVREADLATMFYAKQAVHMGQNVLLDVVKEGVMDEDDDDEVSLEEWDDEDEDAPKTGILIDMNDGDIISIALAFAPERIDPLNGRFRNKMYIRLPAAKTRAKTAATKNKKKTPPKKSKKAWANVDVSCDYYVDVNKLFFLIKNDKRFRGNGVQNPHLTLISLIILCGNDFFGDYAYDDYGLFYNMGNIDHVIGTFMSDPAEYSHMFQLYYSNTYGDPRRTREPVIDEDKFIDFIWACYKSKWGTQTIKKFGDDSRASLTKYCELRLSNCKRKKDEPDVKWERRLLMARRQRIPPPHIMLRYGGLLRWNLLYWYNEYRPEGKSLLDPLRKKGGVSVFGYDKDPDSGVHFLSPTVARMNTDDHADIYKRHMKRLQVVDGKIPEVRVKKKKRKTKGSSPPIGLKDKIDKAIKAKPKKKKRKMRKRPTVPAKNIAYDDIFNGKSRVTVN